MPVLNPFLRALFQSSALSQALPSKNYVLLVPTTDSLLNGQDHDSGKRYAALVDDEDFLGSHILRVMPPSNGSKENNIRDNRSKAKTYSTVNSRTVIIKENMVYSNKGFKQLSQAQLLSDVLYHPPTNDMQQWLVYYISRPLVGTYEAITIKSAVIGPAPENRIGGFSAQASQAPQPKKKDVKAFNELLNQFPMIARQMQPGLERLFNEFGKELGKPLPPPPSRASTNGSLDGTTQASESSSIRSNETVKLPFNSAAYFEDEEDLMRKALETAVTAAIDLFQDVDKQQLSLLGATTDLTGPAIEKLIERYVAEWVHDTLLFPRLCSFHRAQDQELDRRIRQMECLDVSQVGIEIEDGRQGKQALLARIERGVAVFRKMGVAGSPQQMLEILLETQKAVSEASKPVPSNDPDVEKRAAAFTINADVLVSLLLLVVIRSQVRHLQSRLAYMQRFIYIDDVESGEIGYALSTLEAVLTYLAQDSGGLRKASKQNQSLWNAVKYGNLTEIRSIFAGSSDAVITEDASDETPIERPSLSRRTTRSEMSIECDMNGTITRAASRDNNLAHVFPFQAAEDNPPSMQKRKKRVHMDSRSMSVSSSVSLLSRTATLASTFTGIEGDTSVESLAQTQDPAGNTVLMMAVEKEQSKSLEYLLSLSDHYPPSNVLEDTTSEGSTLLSAAIQLANTELVDIILDYVQLNAETQALTSYFAKADVRGRTAAHYLFNEPRLIPKLANMLPWRQKDNRGQSPLFAICRTYDHNDYSNMVSAALNAARDYQADGQALRLEDHADVKGNTLLHIINEPTITHRVLHQCDVDPNAMNDKRFTPLMLASKYGRVDMVRIFFGDPRVELHLRELRGLTAVELAKDDEVRNRIDDLTLFSATSSLSSLDSTGRLTAIVRSFFVEDGSTRFILKSGAPNASISNTTYTITTSRRSLQDFENLAKWLAMDNPSSYMPAMTALNFRTPFQIHSRPSRAVLHNTQNHLDRFLKIMMAHPTFSQHEMLWEFFLVPDMQQEQMAQRVKLKAELLQERLADDFEPLTSRPELEEVEMLVTHSRDIVRKLNIATKSIIRRGHAYVHAQSDLAESLNLANAHTLVLGHPSKILPASHVEAFSRMAKLMYTEPSSSALQAYVSALASFHSTILAMQSALLKPSTLVTQIITTQRGLTRNRSALQNNTLPRKGIMNINFPGMEENRSKSNKDTEAKIVIGESDVEKFGKELRYTKEVVVGELAGWTTWREEWSREEIKKLVRGTVVRERERLKGMQRALRAMKDPWSASLVNGKTDTNFGG